jgi:hypothetical protein
MDTKHQQTALSGTKIDIGAALEFAKSDPDWVKKCGLHGLMLLIPIVGGLSVLGWSRKIYETAKTGEQTFPDLDLGSEISHGVAPLVALLNIMAIVLCASVLSGVGTAISSMVGGDAGGVIGIVVMLLISAMMMLIAIMSLVMLPEIQRRGYNGEMGPLFSPRASLRAIKANPKAYAMTILGLFVAGFISSIGGIACWVGALFTVPFGNAMGAHILAQWDSMVQLSEEG